MYVLGIDSSTQSTKIEAIELQTGQVIATARAPHPATSPPVSEQDPHSWWNALLGAMGQLTELLPDVVALAVAGQQHGLVMLDEDNAPVRKAKLWNDTTSAPERDRLVSAAGPETWARSCGSVPAPAFTVTKLAWMAEHEPASLLRTVRVGLPHDYLNLMLSGSWATDRGDASGTGYWSPTDGAYRPDLLSAVGVDPASIELPRVAAPFDPVGAVSSPELRRLGLRGDVVVGPGTGDNMAGALGLGMVPGDIAVSLGTSGTAYAVSKIGTADETGMVAGFADATGHYLPLVCTLNATKVTETVRQLLGVSYAEFDDLALASPTGASGLTLVPYFDGERTPNRPNATGGLGGLRTATSRADLARAAVEGVACGLLDGVDALRRCGIEADGRFFLIGGGARSEAYQQAFATLADRPILVPDSDETVAIGAAVQAACVYGGESPQTISQRWGLGNGTVHDAPAPAGVAVAEVRDRYRLEAALR